MASPAAKGRERRRDHRQKRQRGGDHVEPPEVPEALQDRQRGDGQDGDEVPRDSRQAFAFAKHEHRRAEMPGKEGK
jgi:hypothetical protein